MKTKYLLSLMFLILLAIMPAFTNAEMIVNDISNPIYPDNVIIASSVDTVYVDSCSFTKYDVTLTNPYDFAVSVSASVSDIALMNKPSTWVDFPTLTYLAAGASKIVPVYVKAPCDIEGTYSFKLNFVISAGLTSEKELVQNLVVRKVNNLQVTYQENATGCPCTPLNYIINIKNTGTFEESYQILPKSFKDYVTFSQTIVTISPQETKKIIATLNLPCSKFGYLPFVLEVDSLNSKIMSQMTLVANVNQCYGFSLSGPANMTACKESVSTHQYTIYNNANITNTYDITLKGSKYSYLDGNELTLQPGQVGTFNLIVDPAKPKFLQKAVDDNLSIVVKSNLGNTVAEKDLVIDVEKCYDLHFNDSFNVKNVVSKSTSFDVCKYDKKAILYLTNSGNFAETIVLDVYSVGVPIVYNKEFNISANSTIPIELIFNGTINNSFKASVIASVKLKSDIKTEVDIKFNKLSDEKCYGFDISPKKINTTHANLTFTNTGVRDNVYELEVYNNKNLSRIDKNVIILSAGNTTNLSLSLATKLNVTVNNGTANKTSVLNVTDTKIQSNIYAVSAVSGYSKVVPVVYDVSKINWLLWLLLLFLLLLLLLLIWLVIALKNKKKNKTKEVTRKQLVKELVATKLRLQAEKKARKEAKKEKKPFNLWWIWLILLLLLLLTLGLVWFMALMPYNTVGKERYIDGQQDSKLISSIDKNDTYKILDYNSQYRLNLSQIFYDADGDILNFTGKSSGKLNMTIKNETALIVPDQNVSGYAGKVNFKAIDSVGAKASSPDIQIYVKARQVFYDEFKREMLISILLILLIIVVLVKLVSKKKDKVTNKKN